MKIKLPDFSQQLEDYINELNQRDLVPAPLSRGYFILRGLGENIDFFPGKYRLHLDSFPEKLIFEEPDEWTTEWRKMWPTVATLRDEYGVSIGYDVRSSQKAIDRKMKTFLRDFHSKFSEQLGKTSARKKKELIFQATKLYLEEQKEKNWQYTRKSMHFIEKEGDSTLEKYIHRILSGETASESKGNNFYIS